MKLFFGHRALTYDHVLVFDGKGDHYFRDMWRFTICIEVISGYCTNFIQTTPQLKYKRLA